MLWYNKNFIKKRFRIKKIIEIGIDSGKVYGFPDFLWQKIQNQNIRNIDSFESVFRDGANKGYCTVASKQLSYSLTNCFIAGGLLPILIGTDNCQDGSHTWIIVDNYIIDTSLMLIIEEEYAKCIGYLEISRINPNHDPIYLATKDFTNDISIKK